MSETLKASTALSTLGAALASAQSIETKVASSLAASNVTATDVASIAGKVVGITNVLSKANLTASGSVASYAAIMPSLAIGVSEFFPAYSEAIKLVGAAIGGLFGLFGIFGTRKAAVANATTSAIVAPVSSATVSTAP